MIVLTFPSIAPGETAIRAQDKAADLDATVGYCARIGTEWTAVLWARRDDPRFKVVTVERTTLAELRNTLCGRLEVKGQWWR
jgi:hypothetical protein